VRGFALRIAKCIATVSSETFHAECRTNASHFTRTRKMPLTTLVLTTLFRKGRSLRIELKDFAEKLKSPAISKAGYLKQRLKLNPSSFLCLARFHAKQFYRAGPNIKTFKGHLVLACDGGDLNIPSTPENIKKFHNASKKKGRPRPQAGISCMFDVLNRQICDASISYTKASERVEALSHIKKR
jgi:hypothetical protein